MDDNKKDMPNESNDYMNNRYKDVNFTMQEFEKPKKKSKKKAIFGYIAIVLISAMIGGVAGGYIISSKIKCYFTAYSQ